MHEPGCPVAAKSRISSREDTYEGDAISLRPMEYYNKDTSFAPPVNIKSK